MTHTPDNAPKRRTLLVGAGVAGAAAAVAALMPASAPTTAVVEATKALPADEPSGYRLTEHVQRYYDTARG